MVIYKITNKINNKVYIGQTKQDLKKRLYSHYNCKASLISKAFKKYGKENFIIEIIHKCETKKQLDYYEELYIKQYNCKVPYGYNILDGGLIRRMHSRSKKLLSKRLGKKIIRINPKTKEYKIYNSINSTKKDGFTPQNIYSCCKNKKKTHKKFIWQYYNIIILNNLSNIINEKMIHKFSQSKLKGISYHKKTKKWQANFYTNHKTEYIGLYNTKLEAINAINNHKNILSGGVSLDVYRI